MDQSTSTRATKGTTACHRSSRVPALPRRRRQTHAAASDLRVSRGRPSGRLPTGDPTTTHPGRFAKNLRRERPLSRMLRTLAEVAVGTRPDTVPGRLFVVLGFSVED